MENKKHEMKTNHVISTYNLGNENVYTLGELSHYPIYGENPEYVDEPKNIGWKFVVAHVEVDGDIDDVFRMEFDNLHDAMNLHNRLYQLSYTDEHRAYFMTEKRKQFDKLDSKSKLKEFLES